MTASSTNSDRASFLAVLACFALSGFAGLLYQTAWTREFAFVFGTSEVAVAVVLAGYMAGLAAGAAIAGRWITRVGRPLLAYGVLEGAIALSALAAPLAIAGVQELTVQWFGGLPEPPSAHSFVRSLFQLGSSLAILFVPTALMGATLPLLARHAVRSEAQIGGRVGGLYAVNTLGAVFGAVVTAFVLLPELGLRLTVWVGVAVNLTVFLIAAGLAQFSQASLASDPTEQGGVEKGDLAKPVFLILPLMLVGGFASFAYEVLWTRLLGQLLGGTIYAFATMLASFLAGITIGSAIAAPLARSRKAAVVGFVCAELGLAISARAAFWGLDRLPELAASFGAGGAGFHPERDALMSALVLLPSTIFLGATFPFAVRIFARSADHAASASARVYVWNTLGGVAGALAAGLWLMPETGFAQTVRAMSVLNGCLALAGCFLLLPARKVLAGGAGVLTLVLAFAPIDEPWRLIHVMSLGGQVVDADLAFFKVGRSSTVMLTVESEGWGLRTNGLPESNILRVERDEALQGARWLSALPILINPKASSMLVVGLGGGVVVESIPSSIKKIDVVELETVVLEANQFVAGRRFSDPLSDPRVSVAINDVRGALSLTTKKWDVVASQPSHPWTPGASHLYTREFASLVHDHLNPGGVFLQWIGQPFVDPELLRGLVGSMADVFEHTSLYLISGSFLILGSDASTSVEAAAQAVIDEDPDAFARAGILAPEDAWIAERIDADGIPELVEGALRSTDEYNIMLTRSPRILGQRSGGGGWSAFFEGRESLAAASSDGMDLLYAIRKLLSGGRRPLAEELAKQLRRPTDTLVARGYLEADKGDKRWAAESFRAALAQDPRHHEAAAALYLLAREAGQRIGPLALASLSSDGRVVVEAQRRSRGGDFEGVEDLDEDLAKIRPRDPLFGLAGKLRAQWRIEVLEKKMRVEGFEASPEDRARAEEAFAIVRRARWASGSAGAWLVLRGRAALVRGWLEQAESDLRAGLRLAKAGEFTTQEVGAARSLVDQLPLARDGEKRRVLLQLIEKVRGPGLSPGLAKSNRNL